jgi:hypothetical protein
MFGSRQICTSTRSTTRAACLLLLALFVVGCASYGPKQQSSLPSLALSASAFNFNTVVVGHSATQTLTVSNTGASPLQISALSVSNKEFSISGPSVPRTILPANSLSYVVEFAPTSAGSASAIVNITTNASSAPTAVSLAGSGEKAFADLAITPASINFGNLVLNSTKTENVTLQNTGDINLTIQGVTVAGSGFGYSDLSPGFSLAPNQKITFQVWFSPKVAGPASANVSLLSPNISSAGTLSLTGDGVSSTSPPPATSTQHTVQLGWGASSSQVEGYRVYRREATASSYSALNGTPIASLSYDDATVSSGATYYYVVTAVDTSGNESVYSNEATAVVPSP